LPNGLCGLAGRGSAISLSNKKRRAKADGFQGAKKKRKGDVSIKEGDLCQVDSKKGAPLIGLRKNRVNA